MKNRKFNPRQLELIAEVSNVPLGIIQQLYEKGLLNENRMYKMWLLALYYKGIYKRKP